MELNIKVGADPELFIRNPNDNTFVCANGRMPGTKAQPHPVQFGAVQVDGFAAEFNIDPAENREDFIRNIKTVQSELAKMHPGFDLVATPTAMFAKDYFLEQPAEARELGCNPDWNAYTQAENPAPKDIIGTRTGSGHIHIGWRDDGDAFDPVHLADCYAIVKQLDHYIGVPSLAWDFDTKRRKMYGKAGAFRPKSYGLEYRTPSNAWLNYGDAMAGWIFDRAKAAVVDLVSGKTPMERSWGNNWAQTVINENYQFSRYWSSAAEYAQPIQLPPVEGLKVA